MLLKSATAEHFCAHGDCLEHSMQVGTMWLQIYTLSTHFTTLVNLAADMQRNAWTLRFSHHCVSALQAIRTVFNVAVGADGEQMQRTARNALLQMLNTVLKHVTLYPLVRHWNDYSIYHKSAMRRTSYSEMPAARCCECSLPC